jgi:hypothetical protein
MKLLIMQFLCSDFCLFVVYLTMLIVAETV